MLKYKKILNKQTNKKKTTWMLNNTLLNNQQNTEEIKEEIKKYLKTNDNENMTVQKLRDAAKPVLRRNIIAIQSYIKKREKNLQ